MKKIFITIFTLISIDSSCQITFPRYYIQNKDTLGIIFSVKQSNEILNDKKKLALYKGLRTGCDSLLQKMWVLNTKYEQNESKYTSLIELYQKNEKEHLSMLQNRESKIDNLYKDLKKCEEQFILKNEQYLNDEKIIGGLKSKQNWLLGGTIGFGILSVFLTGAILAN